MIAKTLSTKLKYQQADTAVCSCFLNFFFSAFERNFDLCQILVKPVEQENEQ